MIDVTNLSKTYDKVEAVKGVSFTVGTGEIYGLLGPNGAGKSTTINIISGLLRPTSGEVTIGGHSIAGDATSAKRILGVVPQQSVVIEELSAIQNCTFFGSLYGVPSSELRARAEKLLDWVGLSDRMKDPVSEYSGGMLRRLTLVLGIIHEPKALILDEPTVGLDPQTRLLLADAIQDIASQGTAVLLSTHYLEEAERLCNRIGIIDEGRIIREGTLAELRAGVEDVQIVSLRGAFDRRPLLDFIESLGAVDIVHDSDEELLLSMPSSAGHASTLLEKAAATDNIKEVAIKPPSLESLFIKLTGRAIRD